MGTPLTDAQVIEFFHLVFLQVLPTRLDRSHYVVKGGANLRYFFESPRYSEDIDLDAILIEPWKLEAKVDEALGSPATGLLLRSGGMTVERVTKPKQTATTQRWKPVIVISGRAAPVHTKIEFSQIVGSSPRSRGSPRPRRRTIRAAGADDAALHGRRRD